MNINYTYEINDLKIEPSLNGFNKVITGVAYSYIGTNEDGVKSAYPGTIQLQGPNDSNFIDLENLNQDTIINWIESSGNFDEIKLLIESKIAEQVERIGKDNSLPWKTN
jgi:hypothetical protein